MYLFDYYVGISLLVVHYVCVISFSHALLHSFKSSRILVGIGMYWWIHLIFRLHRQDDVSVNNIIHNHNGHSTLIVVNSGVGAKNG